MHDDKPHLGAAIAALLSERNVMAEGTRDRISSRTAELSTDTAGRQLGPYLAVSRLHGAGGADLARLVGETLGWPVLDRAVVDEVAKELHIQPNALAALDNGAASWFTDVLVEVMPVDVVSRDTYSHHLRRVLHLLAARGPAVFLGRAAHLFLPRSRGLSVRVVASLEDRVARIRARSGFGEAQALADIEATDRAREHFVSRTFDRRPSDTDLYDMVVSTSRLPIDVLAGMVADACRRSLHVEETPAAIPRATPPRPVEPFQPSPTSR